MITFGGDLKIGASFLTKIERRFIDWMVPKLPSWMRSWHLVLASIPISLLIILSGYLAKQNIYWLWVLSILIALQWLTDSLDGSLGRFRQEGLIRWGYYMDHFLDYIFLCAILIAYSLLLPDHYKWLHFFVLAIFGAYMVNAYLAYGATNKFQVAHLGFGPTEIRLIFILINTLISLFGKTYLADFLPYILGIAFLGLCVVVYRVQREIWMLDMTIKAEQEMQKNKS